MVVKINFVDEVGKMEHVRQKELRCDRRWREHWSRQYRHSLSRTQIVAHALTTFTDSMPCMGNIVGRISNTTITVLRHPFAFITTLVQQDNEVYSDNRRSDVVGKPSD